MELMQPQFTSKLRKSHRHFVLSLFNATEDSAQVLEKVSAKLPDNSKFEKKIFAFTKIFHNNNYYVIL